MSFNSMTNNFLSPLKKQPAQSILVALMIVYGGMVGPKLPLAVSEIMNSFLFRVVFLSLIMWNTNNNPSLSLLMAVVFVMSVSIANGAREDFAVLHPQHHILTGCEKITKSDILGVFNNDEKLLKSTMNKINIPHNVTLTDFNAPQIATYLINYGYSLGDKHKECKINKIA